MTRLFWRSALLFLFFATASYAEEWRGKLALSDIPHVMDTIFEKHVSQKKMTPLLMRHSIETTINQFDPVRRYLLQDETLAYFNLETDQLNQAVSDYNKGRFPLFLDLEQLFQSAILRSREIRAEIQLKDFQEVEDEFQKYQSQKPTDEGDQIPFCQNRGCLKEKIKKELVGRLHDKKKQADQKKIPLSFEEALRRVEAEWRNSENDRFLEGKNGRPLPLQERESVFAFYVLKAMGASLDAHSSFLDPKEAYMYRMRLDNGEDGVGLEVQEWGDDFLISRIFKKSPAEECGKIQAGDQLVAIDGQSASPMELEEVVFLLQGKEGTSVTLTLARKNQPQFQVALSRKKIVLDDDRVAWSFEKFEDGIIGRITINSFYWSNNEVSTSEDVKRALLALEKQGKLKGVILDLRNNRGGYLVQAVRLVGLFMKSGIVVVSKGSDGKEHYYRDDDPSCTYSGPLVVLTSKITASAAEVAAQSIQDWGLGLIVGDERTYGKGSLQNQTATNQSGAIAMKLTTGTYYGVSGETPQGQGVKADIVVPSIFFERKLGESYLNFSLEAQTATPAYADPLTDVSSERKEWFLKYYLPNLQKRHIFDSKLLATLRQKSHDRLEKNQDYQNFLLGKPLVKTVQKNGLPQEVTLTKQESEWRLWQLQYDEAMNILKNLIDANKP